MLGWEYTIDDSVAGYSAAERMYHMCRRRRWVRKRQRTTPAKDTKPKVSLSKCINLIGVSSCRETRREGGREGGIV